MTANQKDRPHLGRWRFRQVDPCAVARLQEILQISELLSAVLVRRGVVDPEVARAFLHKEYAPGDPFALPGMAAAVEALQRAAREGSRVAVYGDYDADGVIGTVILCEALRRFGLAGADGRVPYYIPARADGYGLRGAAVSELAAAGIDLLVTVDCGTTASAEVALAGRLGMDVIITDHHQPPARRGLPPARAIVNPWLSVEPVPARVLCGAGVALKLAQALLGVTFEEWLDLAAVATVADVVPLSGENRGLVGARLPELPHTRNHCLRALIEVAGLAGRALTARDLAFALAPRINALGRTEEGGAIDAVEALRAGSAEAGMHFARRMDTANRRRQTTEEKVLAEARRQLAPDVELGAAALVAAGAGWPLGVIGIVAGRLAREHGRPVAVISLNGGGLGRGSARSIPGLDLVEALGECADLLEEFGGHSGAAGLTVRADLIGRFKVQFAQAVRSLRAPEEALELDAVLPLSEVGEAAVRDLEAMSPFGEGNPEPVLCVPSVTVEDARRVGDGTHLAVTVSCGRLRRRGIAFRIADELSDTCRPGRRVDLACTPAINEFRGNRSVELQIRAARGSTA